MNHRHIVIVGATSTMAEHCARLWATRESVRLTLVGRSNERLQRVATDLSVRAPGVAIRWLCVDLLSPAAIHATTQALATEGPIDQVLIAHGDLPQQLDCQQDLSLGEHALRVNAVSPVLWAEAFAGHMERTNHGRLAVIGSVAGDRGRRSNYVYGAAKGLVERYVQGLQHRLAATAVKVTLIKPGPTATAMTAHLNAQGMSLAAPQEVAHRIVKAMDRGQPVCYAPARWRWIMAVLTALPASVFNRLDI
ncbi:SDR family NAD(P)-dependent oxidoreductase [Pseudoxanthomonas indica]|uniref:Short-chain dehydrogenase n=1 Tax=Pseudoxanthomonas indica TaxID=428993 RepID=A0A1T5LXA1_9GAMM|nr:SDR family NAD(P)-dependent oxidoreductase [Pseudoxanthomonas indica]GGD41410.1 short-chain dehydrogenase [Pseudoxanthomonas indica]SKC80464.1 hypothetical protein SAMN06296058_3314 [Pseudoxanthomonas indica]